jgi:flagellar biosynthesis anti-sigma factor FlgM
MRIHDAYTKQGRPVGAEGSRAIGSKTKEPGVGSASGAAGSVATNVTVSARAKELAAGAEPSAARVDALRGQIRAGTFKVDAQSIAKNLVGADP